MDALALKEVTVEVVLVGLGVLDRVEGEYDRGN